MKYLRRLALLIMLLFMIVFFAMSQITVLFFALFEVLQEYVIELIQNCKYFYDVIKRSWEDAKH